jgi:hypothetical protein
VNILHKFSKKYSNTKFHENSSGGAQLFNADGQTDMTKLLATFRHFAKAPKKKDVAVCDVRKANNNEYRPPAVCEPAGILNNKKVEIIHILNASCVLFSILL